MASNLDDLGARIAASLRRYTLDNILFSAMRNRDQQPWSAFVTADLVLHAVRHCQPSFRMAPELTPLHADEWSALMHLVQAHSLSDPVGEGHQDVPGRPISVLLRHVGHQQLAASNHLSEQARAMFLFEELPRALQGDKKVSAFDFAGMFQRSYGCAVADYVNVVFVAYHAAVAQGAFTRGYFATAKAEGVMLPEDHLIVKALGRLAAEPAQFRAMAERYAQPDRRFASYDFNPLLVYPIIRPWNQKLKVPPDDDRMIAPMPSLLLWRMCTGIYYDMRNEYGQPFSGWFGYIFEAYVGRLLAVCAPSLHLLSEGDIRKAYPSKLGKAPDWVMVDGEDAMLFECKTARFTQKALATGAEDEIEKSLGDVRNGMVQIHEFVKACKDGRVPIAALRGCRRFHAAVVTLEPMFLLNTPLFRHSLDSYWGQDVAGLDWGVASVGDLETLQPYLAAGLSLPATMARMRSEHSADIQRDLARDRPMTFQDSFLFEKNRELYARLGVPD